MIALVKVQNTKTGRDEMLCYGCVVDSGDIEIMENLIVDDGEQCEQCGETGPAQ